MFKSIVNIKKNIIFVTSVIVFCCFEVIMSGQSVVTQSGIAKVVIDAGHGGVDPGATGKISKEKDINLAVSLLVGRYIKDFFPDVEIVYTRSTDTFIPLDERSIIANKSNADLFISIHANASRNKNVGGTETYVMGLHKSESNMEVAMRENAVITYEEDYSSKYEGYDPRSPESFIMFSLLQNVHLEQSLQMAARVQEEFGTHPIKTNRGVKQAGFLVLWRTAMPSILIEMGYISNSQDEKILNSKEGQTTIAKAIFNAFKNYKTYYERRQQLVSYNKPAPAGTTTTHTSKQTTVDTQTQTSYTAAQVSTKKSPHYYCVQIKASSKNIPTDSDEFKGFEDVKCIPSGSIFKYTVGNFTTFEDALQYCRKVIRKKVPDAFVVYLENGKIMPTNK